MKELRRLRMRWLMRYVFAPVGSGWERDCILNLAELDAMIQRGENYAKA